ncbi:acyl-CoA thioesterase II [Martelella alba]|uniref:Acyl-CoA thioesterase II n=1 Tax=Martelella alba TaxID=2590451 RepID=A0ABY2SMB3_9HYPH|nr:acyl-CoA thioesterase II [Martelella alba]TKI06268.1 acyl-CoA thioesterase II [Martelella alba]
MNRTLQRLLALMDLEQIGDGVFRGQSQDMGLPQVFGGQVMGQALHAALRTVPDRRGLHSYHCYFLRPGDSGSPIVYRVVSLRDGKSFSTRQVIAEQSGQEIFYLTGSFQRPENGVLHQDTMPQVPEPEALIGEPDLIARRTEGMPPLLRRTLAGEQAFDMRPVNFHHPLDNATDDPLRYIWLKANGPLPDDDDSHLCLLGYLADFNFLPTALQPHGISFLDPNLIIASIDHAMWFHRPVRLDDWLLYAIDSPCASGGRGYVRGRFFTRTGLLVASTAQEGLIRMKTR